MNASGTHILVVDDNPSLLGGVQLALETAGYQVLTANNGIEALAVLQAQRVDLILADISMPQMNGYQLYERARENPQWVAIPFIFLTARAMDSDIRYGKELGADDYLTKPFEPDDLCAAVRGKLRRARQLAQRNTFPASSAGAEARVLHVGSLRIESMQYRAWRGGKPLNLSAKEFSLLECLAWRVNQVVSHQELIQFTHELDTDPVEAGTLLRPLIRSLRRKLGYPVGDVGCIENVRGVGYRLVPPDD
jgi:two-component system alkaline phosphatase synthesis response regulator PhoP